MSRLIENLSQAEALLKKAQEILGETPLVFGVGDNKVFLDKLALMSVSCTFAEKAAMYCRVLPALPSSNFFPSHFRNLSYK